MRARIISKTPKGKVTSGKLELEVALKMQSKLEKLKPNDSHKIVICE